MSSPAPPAQMNVPQLSIHDAPPDVLAVAAQINDYTKMIAGAKYPFGIPPPYPPAKPNAALSAQVNKMKQTGNDAFKRKKWGEAKRLYSMALKMAASRYRWEPAALTAEETSTLLCNRAAAELALEEYPEALVDADAAISIRKNYGKGYYRKAKALEAMHRFDEAKQTANDGLLLADPGTRNELVALCAVYEKN
ncbi:ER protein translocation subcomplex subunit Sec72 [Schizosaccharomyces japonicus yFS275]|uniref:ER protein translocation subcomplex subunit Sec72 n=1 Tax=Schizosaccharomyces japonicus (strain yFS275 / FY16936) TaxID=402676 RepID=B6K5I1_SCHJY|nr:ER protein translocation subcomplex subunit Sec72 [Schizosaccharomyces japonicus yFS275]EEB08785.1 ER protein translocation subcomplex subunit Sec72 [Schizosaccharomyces japonicus yFS275]